jgi:hypothetical protein
LRVDTYFATLLNKVRVPTIITYNKAGHSISAEVPFNVTSGSMLSKK